MNYNYPIYKSTYVKVAACCQIGLWPMTTTLKFFLVEKSIIQCFYTSTNTTSGVPHWKHRNVGPSKCTSHDSSSQTLPPPRWGPTGMIMMENPPKKTLIWDQLCGVYDILIPDGIIPRHTTLGHTEEFQPPRGHLVQEALLTCVTALNGHQCGQHAE